MNATIRNKLRNHGEAALEPLTSWLTASGISSTLPRVLATIVAVTAAWVIATGQLQMGGLIWLSALVLFCLSSAMPGGNTVFQRLLADTLAHLTESLILVGTTVHLAATNELLAVHYGAVTVLAVLLAGFIRARSESLGLSADVGIATHTERSVLLVIILICGCPLTGVKVILAISAITILQRLLYVRDNTSNDW